MKTTKLLFAVILISITTTSSSNKKLEAVSLRLDYVANAYRKSQSDLETVI